MITAIVRFPLPKGTSLEAAKSMFEKSAPNYRNSQGLVRKYYLFGEDRLGGGGLLVGKPKPPNDSTRPRGRA